MKRYVRYTLEPCENKAFFMLEGIDKKGVHWLLGEVSFEKYHAKDVPDYVLTAKIVKPRHVRIYKKEWISSV